MLMSLPKIPFDCRFLIAAKPSRLLFLRTPSATGSIVPIIRQGARRAAPGKVYSQSCRILRKNQYMQTNAFSSRFGVPRSKRGSTMIDVLVTAFLLAMAGIVFGAAFPSGFSCSRKAQSYKLAAAIAQRKMEQLRSLSYQSLTYGHLRAAGAIDSSPYESPYEFTSTDSIADYLAGGAGQIQVEDLTSTVRRVRVTVSWTDKGEAVRSVTLTGIFADRRTRRAG